jgi:outer membrane protein TolC
MNQDLLLLALVTALTPGLFGAQEPLSLNAALVRAQTQNPELKAMRERASASMSRGEATRKQTLPRAGVMLTAERTDNAAAAFAHKLNAGEFSSDDFEIARLNAPGALSHLGTSLFVEVPVDIAGRVGLAADGQAAGNRAFAQNIREAEGALRLHVTEAYLGAVLARQEVEATEKALLAAKSREEVTQERLAEGLALQADVLRVRARRRSREADLASKRADFAVAQAMLARLMGSPDGAAFDLTDPLDSQSSSDTLDAWKARAEIERPALLASQEHRTAAGLALRLEEKASWPELAAQARLMDDRTSFSGGGRSWAISATLRWNVFDATRGKRVAAALADERATAEDERATHDRVRYEVESTYRRLVAAQERLTAARGGAVEGREALRVVQERRTQGLATLTDELETEAAAFAAELEEIGAVRNTVLAAAALKVAAGHTLGSPMQ